MLFVSRACENVYLASNQFEDLSAFKGRCPIFAWLQSCQTLRRPVSFERQKRDVIKSAPHPTFCHLVVSVSIVLKCADRLFLSMEISYLSGPLTVAETSRLRPANIVPTSLFSPHPPNISS